jgi:hypothetical protein
MNTSKDAAGFSDMQVRLWRRMGFIPVKGAPPELNLHLGPLLAFTHLFCCSCLMILGSCLSAKSCRALAKVGYRASGIAGWQLLSLMAALWIKI